MTKKCKLYLTAPEGPATADGGAWLGCVWDTWAVSATWDTWD